MICDFPRDWIARCPECQGAGRVVTRAGQRHVCPRCHGEGKRLSPPQRRVWWEEDAPAEVVARKLDVADV
jgi:RecJ-like exonuclease